VKSSFKLSIRQLQAASGRSAANFDFSQQLDFRNKVIFFFTMRVRASASWLYDHPHGNCAFSLTGFLKRYIHTGYSSIQTPLISVPLRPRMTRPDSTMSTVLGGCAPNLS
jgi:hypothetical protein